MGLAASHARLCMLTRRKADVEGRLMHIANSKMRLAHDSQKISEEYNRALNATTLTYNTGSKDVPLTYGLIMSPTTQCMLTNFNGAVVLDDAIWNALGSPTPGGALGDEKTFIANMAKVDSSTIDLDKLKTSTPSPGTGSTTNTTTATYSDSQVFGYLNKKYQTNGVAPMKDYFGHDQFYSVDGSTPSKATSNTACYCFWQGNSDQLDNHKSEIATSLKSTLGTIISDASEALSSTLGTTTKNLSTIISTAKAATEAYWVNQLMTNVIVDPTNDSEFGSTQKYANGTSNIFDNGVGGDNDSNKHELIIDPNQVIKMFLNFFDAACNGDLTSANSQDYYKTNPQTTELKKYFKSTPTTTARDNGGVDVSVTIPTTTDTSKTTPTVTPTTAVAYYYNLYEAIKDRGWVKDTNVDNQDYMQGKIQYGDYGIKQYQNGQWVELSTSSPDSPLNISDDTQTQKKAEAKYDAEKDKIKAKEAQLDVEQTNTDTERQAVVTDMDSVKKLIDKNMDAFKLFQQG